MPKEDPMKLLKGIFAFAVFATLAACSSGHPLDVLNRAEAVGSPYNKYLADQYRILASTGGPETRHFAEKGLAAIDGMFVAPEPVTEYAISRADYTDMISARSGLIEALNNGGRDRAPDQASI